MKVGRRAGGRWWASAEVELEQRCARRRSRRRQVGYLQASARTEEVRSACRAKGDRKVVWVIRIGEITGPPG
jgi:hypothetical protein